jgi:acetyl-CoA acetyltransferase
MSLYGATREHMATFAVRNRGNAAENPNAVFYQKPLSRDEYLDARMIAEPLSVLDCDMPVDGCGALVLTLAERAGGGEHRPAYVLGSASLGLPPRRSVTHTLDGATTAAGQLASALWANTGLLPADVTLAQVYDGFSWFVYLYLEAFGLFKTGEAFRALQDDTTTRTGTLPINTGGGALGMGRLHGTPQLIEAVLQVQGRCGSRQVADPSVTLACTGAPFRGCAALVVAPD